MTECAYCKKSFNVPDSEDKSVTTAATLPFLLYHDTLNDIEGLKENIVTYNNVKYHAECLTKYLSASKLGVKDAQIVHHFNMKDLALIVKDMQTLCISKTNGTGKDMSKDMNYKVSLPYKRLLIRFRNVLCEENSEYLKCTNPECNKLILRQNAIIGKRTKAYQQLIIEKQSENTIGTESESYKKDSKAYRVFYFCCDACDGYFSSKLHNSLQNRIDEAKKVIKDTEDSARRNIENYKTVFNKSEREIKKYTEKYLQRVDSVKRFETWRMRKDIMKIVKEMIG